VDQAWFFLAVQNTRFWSVGRLMSKTANRSCSDATPLSQPVLRPSCSMKSTYFQRGAWGGHVSLRFLAKGIVFQAWSMRLGLRISARTSTALCARHRGRLVFRAWRKVCFGVLTYFERGFAAQYGRSYRFSSDERLALGLFHAFLASDGRFFRL
jgi:hypothetical protein